MVAVSRITGPRCEIHVEELRLTEVEVLALIRVLRSHPDMTETEARTAARVCKAFAAALADSPEQRKV